MSYINREYNHEGNYLIDYDNDGVEIANYEGGNCGCSNCLKGGALDRDDYVYNGNRSNFGDPKGQYLGHRNIQTGNISSNQMYKMAHHQRVDNTDNFQIPSSAGYVRSFGYEDPYQNARLAHIKNDNSGKLHPKSYANLHQINNFPMNGDNLRYMPNGNYDNIVDMEGSGWFDDLLHGVSTIGADIIGKVPVVGSVFKPLWQHLPDIAHALSPGYHYPYGENQPKPEPPRAPITYTSNQLDKYKSAASAHNIKGRGLKYPKKGSQEARNKMAYLRSLRR